MKFLLQPKYGKAKLIILHNKQLIKIKINCNQTPYGCFFLFVFFAAFVLNSNFPQNNTVKNEMTIKKTNLNKVMRTSLNERPVPFDT